jgi:hypothetical protein
MDDHSRKRNLNTDQDFASLELGYARKAQFVGYLNQIFDDEILSQKFREWWTSNSTFYTNLALIDMSKVRLLAIFFCITFFFVLSVLVIVVSFFIIIIIIFLFFFIHYYYCYYF